MAHVFYADEKPLPLVKSKQQKTSVRTKDVKQSWSASLTKFFTFVKWVDDSRIYHLVRLIPRRLFNGFGHLIGYLIMGTSKTVKQRIFSSLTLLHPDLSVRKLEKYALANSKYLGMLILDIFFQLPLTSDLPNTKFFSYQHLDRLDQALKKGKGVIIPTVHIGQYFHVGVSIYNHPKRYPVCIIAKLDNLPLFQNINRSKYNNVYLIAATKFERILPFIKKQMALNRIIVTYHDYSNPSQLRVPIWKERYPTHLIHTPQSYIALHKLTGAEILPAVAIPNNVFGKSTIIFLDNSKIQSISKKYIHQSSKQFHGELSIALNASLYPYVVQYSHLWEEIMRLGAYRMTNELSLEGIQTNQDFIEKSFEKMHEIIDNSYEPERFPFDAQLHDLIDHTYNDILNYSDSLHIFTTFPSTHLSLTGLTGIGELKTIIQFLSEYFRKTGQIEISTHLENLLEQILQISG